MNCNFKKYKTEVATHYIGSVTGNEYPVDEYHSFGSGDRGSIKDLPKSDYPYTVKYDSTFKWKICRECDCVDKLS